MRQRENATFNSVPTLVFAGAHETLLVYRASTGRCEQIPTSGAWLGMIRDIGADVPETSCRLYDGDVLMLYTDGVVEARSVDGIQYGLERLARDFEAVAALSVEGIREHVIASVHAWMSRQDDDMTVLVARHRHAPRS